MFLDKEHGRIFNFVENVFRVIEVTENTLSLFEQHPLFDYINHSLELYRTNFVNRPDWLQKDHVEELVGRWEWWDAFGSCDIFAKPTVAEMIYSLSEMSLKQPLNSTATNVYAFLMNVIIRRQNLDLVEIPCEEDSLSVKEFLVRLVQQEVNKDRAKLARQIVIEVEKAKV